MLFESQVRTKHERVFDKQQKIPSSFATTCSFEISKMRMILQVVCVLERILS